MKWRRRWRAWLRRRALARLIPNLSYDEQSEELICVAVPINKTMIGDPSDLFARGQLCDYVRGVAGITASQAVKDKWPIRFPDQLGNAFKEGWKNVAAS